ncbi:hypothetical protein ACIQ7D_37155 [Streptomyces sp. NPDC096310]|uniref:hypothetical protein n=1 Tax=Streptomyces sp. NPDC096310 TaxID=3366082 RepID=UPI0037F8132D
MLKSLSALPDSSDETIGAAADAANMVARYRASQGSYAAASLREIAERLVVSTGKKKGRDPSAATVMRMLRDDEKALEASDYGELLCPWSWLQEFEAG